MATGVLAYAWSFFVPLCLCGSVPFAPLAGFVAFAMVILWVLGGGGGGCVVFVGFFGLLRGACYVVFLGDFS